MVSDTTAPSIPTALAALLADTRPVGHTVEADTDRVELIADLERVKSSICAYQADLAVDLDRSVKAREAEADQARPDSQIGAPSVLPRAPAAGSPPRSRSPARSHPTADRSSSASPTTSPPTCPAPEKPYATGASTSTAPCSWPARPAA